MIIHSTSAPITATAITTFPLVASGITPTKIAAPSDRKQRPFGRSASPTPGRYIL